jgi:DNA-binding Lrp family transcriptional regulator
VQSKSLILEKNSLNLLKNIVVLSLKDGNKSVKELSKATGITEEPLKAFLENYVKEGVIKKSGKRYALK